MPIVETKKIYEKARLHGYGVAGFCAENLEMILAILQAANETQSPVVIALWEKDIEYAGEGSLEAVIANIAAKAVVPVGIMLDHGTSLESCLNAVELGHTCVMIDASHESFDRNIELTKEVCDAVHPMGVIVEGELGTIRRSFESEGAYARDSIFTDPDAAAEYIMKSDADAVAVSVGNESGFIKHELDFARISGIRRKTDAHIIIHGGSCISDEDITKAVKCGATAFRFASENRITLLDGVEKARKELPLGFPDTRLIYKKAVKEVKKLISRRMLALGCVDKARYFK